MKAFEIHREETGEPWIVYMYAGFFHLCVAVDDIHEIWDRLVKTNAPLDELFEGN